MMIVVNFLLYYLIIIPISLLPFPLLYGVSGFLYLVLYKIIGYRKNIVLGNIQRSFPEKTEKEHIEICNKFYSHFCDLIVESLKTFTISEKQVLKRVKCKNPEFINKYYDNINIYTIYFDIKTFHTNDINKLNFFNYNKIFYSGDIDSLNIILHNPSLLKS